MQLLNAGSAITLEAKVFDVSVKPQVPVNPDSITVSIYDPLGAVIVAAQPMVYQDVGHFVFQYQSIFSALNGPYTARYDARYNVANHTVPKHVAFIVQNGESQQGVDTLPPDISSGITYGRTVYVLNSTDNVGVLTIASGLQQGRRIKALTTHQTIAFGTSRGLTTFSVGGMGDPLGWGTGIPIALGTESTYLFTRGDEPMTDVNYDITLTADAGLFDATGQIRVSVHWETYAPSVS